MVEMRPSDAREFWKALMDNASALITDAHALLAVGSYGRARSLSVLAQEELGKALWIYDAFSSDWSRGNGEPRAVDELARHGRDHTRKYLQAVVFGDELAEFWGDYSQTPDLGLDLESWQKFHEQRRAEAELAAREANNAKKRGFYVDRTADGTVSSPTELSAGTTDADLRTAAQVIEMLLIRDHTRMKHDAATPYDSTHEQQFRLLLVAHPEEWAAFSRTVVYENSREDPDPMVGDARSSGSVGQGFSDEENDFDSKS
jgi:AbiV family abortive infection protein